MAGPVDADLVQHLLQWPVTTALEQAKIVLHVCGRPGRVAGVLRDLGVEPPMKISKQTGRPAYAFAKSDKDLTDLLEHEDPRVRALLGEAIDPALVAAEEEH